MNGVRLCKEQGHERGGAATVQWPKDRGDGVQGWVHARQLNPNREGLKRSSIRSDRNRGRMRHSGTHILPTPSPNNTECHHYPGRESLQLGRVRPKGRHLAVPCAPMPSLLLKQCVVSEPTQAQAPTFSTPPEKKKKEFARGWQHAGQYGQVSTKTLAQAAPAGRPQQSIGGAPSAVSSSKDTGCARGRHTPPTGEDATQRTHTSPPATNQYLRPHKRAPDSQKMRQGRPSNTPSLMHLRCPLFG
jgi:hypothetical protein